MPKDVTLKIDGRALTVPAGTLVVDAARRLGVNIPVFCYHPKLKPVGMCRMCLVEIGRPALDPATRQPVLEADGSPKIQFGPKLETACTTPVSEGMVVLSASDKVKAARREVLEFLLTSHPLDCPICDKGGECPLQNLTLEHGPGESRFLFDEKNRASKHVPLGELIYLDRERCIQCARCVRFQDEVAGDPVIGFSQRGRALEITTRSRPGFDSIFSGNTSDICPVGALTTADFRFGARPWELTAVASICNLCPVGCNLTYNLRREAKSGGRSVIKRAMPRQNEAVNETWICDKGRFGHHYVESPQRITQPLLRKDGELQPVEWEEALEAAAGRLSTFGSDMAVLAGGVLANEDLFNLAMLARSQGGQALLHTHMGGGDLTLRLGAEEGFNLGALGRGDVILAACTDLHQEAPLWWLRVKQAVERGATLVVCGARPTRLDGLAAWVLRSAWGEEESALLSLTPENAASAPEAVRQASEALVKAERLVIFFGSDGLGLCASAAVARACAALLYTSGKAGKPGSAMLGVWHAANLQGAWETGFRPAADLEQRLERTGLVVVAGADPAGDDPRLAAALRKSRFVIVQELFLTETARLADIVFPVQAHAEREGSYTSGERRAQRFYPAIAPLPGTRPDFAVTAEIGRQLRRDFEDRSAAAVFRRLAEAFASYSGLSYQALAQAALQEPLLTRHDLYYGGTSYENRQGLGATLRRVDDGALVVMEFPPMPKAGEDGLLLVPVTRLYDHGTLMQAAQVLDLRKARKAVWMHPATAERFGWTEYGRAVLRSADGLVIDVEVRLDEGVPQGSALLPRSAGVPLRQAAVFWKQE